ncbi:IS481 family transposase, partial [Methylobacterium longum]|nr:IS481 family transposase [Methylobacterium longum]
SVCRLHAVCRKVPPRQRLRFNGRVQREVVGITLYRHADLEIVLRGFNAAYNGRRQRVLNGLSPEMVLRQRLEADPALANPTYRQPSSSLIKRALRIVEEAKEVSHPDS